MLLRNSNFVAPSTVLVKVWVEQSGSPSENERERGSAQLPLSFSITDVATHEGREGGMAGTYNINAASEIYS